MNELAKRRLSIALLKAMEKEKISPDEADSILDLKKYSIRNLLHPSHWSEIPDDAWRAIRTWRYSGCKLRDYNRKEYINNKNTEYYKKGKKKQKNNINKYEHLTNF